jgi:hypothetical protein
LGGSRQHDRGRRDDEVRAVMLAHAEHVETHLIGQLDLLHEVAEPLRVVDHLTGHGVGRALRERVDADLHRLPMLSPFARYAWTPTGELRTSGYEPVHRPRERQRVELAVRILAERGEVLDDRS